MNNIGALTTTNTISGVPYFFWFMANGPQNPILILTLRRPPRLAGDPRCDRTHRGRGRRKVSAAEKGQQRSGGEPKKVK